VRAEQLALLLQRIADGTISNKIAERGDSGDVGSQVGTAEIADQIIESKGLKTDSDSVRWKKSSMK